MSKTQNLRHIFFAAVAMAVVFPFLNIGVINPSIRASAVQQAERDSVQLANHLRLTTISTEEGLGITPALSKEIYEVEASFKTLEGKVRGLVTLGTGPAGLAALVLAGVLAVSPELRALLRRARK